jgi:CYTH domain-containing protein
MTVPRKRKANSRRSASSVEIERKFKVHKLPENLGRFSHQQILQGYLAVTRDGTEVRIRKEGGKYFLTIKHGSGKTRVEEEIAISGRQFTSLWDLTGRKSVKKVRYRVPHEGTGLEVDVYQGRLEGLMTAEVEFRSEKASDAFRPPPWLGTEITKDQRYKNRNLALRGLPKGWHR